MSRARQTFRQCDLAKAVKTLAKAGLAGRIELVDGKIVVYLEAPSIVPKPPDAIDSEWE